MSLIVNYFRELILAFGQGWNRFWYTPSHPLPLGIIRICAALIALASLISYTPDLDRLLSANGMMPVQLVVDLQTALKEDGTQVLPWRWSYLDGLSGQELHIAHTCGMAVMVVLALGFLTRISSVLALVVFLAYLHRVPQVTMYHERVLPFVLFYLALGPSGATLSLDRWIAHRRKAPLPQPTWTATVPLRMMQIHLAVISFMMVIGKLSNDASWWSGMALWWLAIVPDGPLLNITWLNNNHRFILNFWSHAIVFFELAFPFLVWNRYARPLMVVLGLLVWTSVMIASGQVLFISSLMTALLSFVSGEQWMALAACCGCCKSASK